MAGKKKKKSDLDNIKDSLEKSAEFLRDCLSNPENVRRNRKEIVKKLRAIEENTENVKMLLKALRRKATDSSRPTRKYPLKFLTEKEYRKLYPDRKAVVFFHKSDFRTLDEYIDAMRKPPIKKDDVDKTDWNDLAQRLVKK